jgi:hypothetical protein
MQPSDESTSRNIEWGPRIILAAGALLFLLGAGRFVLAHHLSLSDALYCFLLVIPAWLLLLIIAYVVQHAILASVIPIAAAAMWAYSSPIFDIALGLALMAIISESIQSERKCQQALRKYNDGSDGEKEERQ